jgi:hypothetical protein
MMLNLYSGMVTRASVKGRPASASWRWQCRVPSVTPLPHPSTVEKTTSRCEEAALAQLDDGLVDKAENGDRRRLPGPRRGELALPGRDPVFYLRRLLNGGGSG